MGLYVLMYHSVLKKNNKFRYGISLDDFKRQMEYLKNVNIKKITTEGLSKGDVDENANNVMVTFDDGYKNNFENAYPILKENNIPAVFFITTEWVGRDEMMGWQHIKVMAENGMVIESHAHTHRFLTGLKDSVVIFELQKSRNMIKRKIDFPCNYVSCPGGRVDSRIIKMAKDLGFKGIFTSSPGINKIKKNCYVFNRILIHNKMDFTSFVGVFRKREGAFFIDKCCYNLKVFLKFMIGNKIYYRIWAGINKK